MASGLCVPHQQAAHMAAPTEGQNIKKALAKGEPSTHGAKQTFAVASVDQPELTSETQSWQHQQHELACLLYMSPGLDD